MSGRKRTLSPSVNSPTSTLLPNPQLSNRTNSMNSNSPNSLRPMNINSPRSVKNRPFQGSVRTPKNLNTIQIRPFKRQRVSKAVSARMQQKLENTAGETSGNNSNSTVRNRPKPKKARIASAAMNSSVRQNVQAATRTAANLVTEKQQKIKGNYDTLINQRNTLPPGYKVGFRNQLLLNTAKKGDKAVKLIQARMRKAVAEGLNRSKNLRNLAKKLSPNGQKKFTNAITNNLNVRRYMFIKNAISKAIKSEAKEKAAKEKAAKEKEEANKVLNSAIQQRRVNAEKLANANTKKPANANIKKPTNANIKKPANTNTKKPANANANRVTTVAVVKSRPQKVKNMSNEQLISVLNKNASVIEKTDKKMPSRKQTSKKLLLNTIDSINNSNKSTTTKGAKQHLRFLYTGLSDARLKNFKDLKTRDAQMRILRQFTALKRKIVAVPNNQLKINLDENGTLDFLFLMWCDMLHDKTVNSGVSFQNFLNGGAVKTLFPGPGIKFTSTIFIESLVDASNDVFIFKLANNRRVDVLKNKTTAYEAGWKEAMTQGDIPIEQTDISSPNKRPRITKQIIAEHAFRLNSIRPDISKKVYISIDQESVSTKEFSRIIDRSRNGNEYKFGSIIGYANLFDAGVDMVTKGKQQDRIRSRAWGMTNPKNIKFTMNYYSALFQVEINGRGKNSSNNQNTERRATFGFDEYENENGEIKFILNGEEIKPSRGAKKAAQSTGNPSQQLIKFMGDFMQILTALHAQENAGDKILYIPASGDGMFVVIYMYLARKLGLVPKIITSIEDQSVLHFVNLSDIIAGASNETSYEPSGISLPVGR